MNVKSYLSPKTRVMKSRIHERGLFAIKPINQGEIVSIKGGHIVDEKTLRRFKNIIRNSELQIEDDFFLAPLNKRERETSMMFLNHSCNPNLGIKGNIVFVAMRDIKPGEELTIDYAMFDDANCYEMKCNCHAKNCRKIIKGGDWKDLGLQKRYEGYFSAFIQRKIDIIKKRAKK